MIYSVSGKLILSDGTSAVVECGGVGMKCFVSLNTARVLPSVGQQVTLLTHLSVREDAMDLFGFATSDELDMFRLITSISGVGPKLAMSILSEFTPDKLCLYIAGGDAKAIQRANGVGAKLAQRMVLELKEKVSGIAFADGDSDISAAVTSTANSNTSDAVEALVSLGYTQSEAAVAIGKLNPDLSVEELIKAGLKSLAKF